MKRKVFITVGALLIIAVALVWLGNYRNAPAVTAQTGSNMTDLHAADISAYRWEAMAKAYVTQQGSPDQDSSILSATSKYDLEYPLDSYGISPGREVQNEAAVPTVNSLDGTDKYAFEYKLDSYGISPGREVQNEAAVPTVNSLDGTDKYAFEYVLDSYGSSNLVETVRQATNGYKDIAKAEDDGYGLFLGCVSGRSGGAMGVHYPNGNLIGDGALDAMQPEVLIYEVKNGKQTLVGVEYLVLYDQWHANNPDSPPVLMGHVFNYSGSPNRYGMPAFYELHVWAWKTNPSGVFSDWNPNVSCEEFTN